MIPEGPTISLPDVALHVSSDEWLIRLGDPNLLFVLCRSTSVICKNDSWSMQSCIHRVQHQSLRLKKFRDLLPGTTCGEGDKRFFLSRGVLSSQLGESYRLYSINNSQYGGITYRGLATEFVFAVNDWLVIPTWNVVGYGASTFWTLQTSYCWDGPTWIYNQLLWANGLSTSSIAVFSPHRTWNSSFAL